MAVCVCSFLSFFPRSHNRRSCILKRSQYFGRWQRVVTSSEHVGPVYAPDEVVALGRGPVSDHGPAGASRPEQFSKACGRTYRTAEGGRFAGGETSRAES